jgi:large subunit ribosomal protein L21
MYAIVETGGKQYRVQPGQTIQVERLPAIVGDSVTLDRVLMVADGEEVTVGRPTVEGAAVQATVVGEGKARKVVIYKYLPRHRYRRKKGHRQLFTRLRIESIEL